MPTNSVKNYKSIFVLHIYEMHPFEKKTYRIHEEDIKRYAYAKPGFRIFESKTAYCQSLAEAEKHIHEKIKIKDIYGFVVEEKPLDYTIQPFDRISIRRYLKDGSLWQKSEVSNIRKKIGDDCDLGDFGFYGRDPKTIPFKEGDIVEVVENDFVHLAIIWSLPATIEDLEEDWADYKNAKDKTELDIYPDESDDVYYTVNTMYYDTEKGHIGCEYTWSAVVEVLPPSLPVPKKLETELREKFKTHYEGCVDII